jgi:hypothetical protein
MRLLHIGFALLLATAGYADIVTLKSGRVINGTYLGGSAREVRVEVGDQIETFDTSQVAKIEFGNGTAGATSDRNRPVLRRSDSNSDSDEGRPTLRRESTAPPASTAASNDGRPTLRREPSGGYDDAPPTLRRGGGGGEAPTVMRPGDTGPGAASTPASVAAARTPVEIPSGTNLVVRIIDAVDSEKASAGQTFRASIDQPVTAGGEILIPRGADALVKLVEAKEAGKLTGHAELTLALSSVTVDGRVIEINTQSITQESDSRGKRTATKAGGGAVLGAIIGGLAGGAAGAAAGAGAGAAAGTGVEAVSKGPKVKIPSETRLTFVLDNPITI